MNNINLSFIKDFMMAALNIEVNHLSYPYDNLETIDHGLMKVIYKDYNYKYLPLISCAESAKDNTVYFLKNNLEQTYVLLKIPQTRTPEFIIIGPFLYEEPTIELYKLVLRQNRISSSALSTLSTYFTTIPVVEDVRIHTTIQTIASYLFEQYNPDNNEHILLEDNIPFPQGTTEALNLSMGILEKRYKTENQLLDAIAKGDCEDALKYLNRFSAQKLPPRVNNPVRNMKNTLFILNTLYRKASESGNVHPIYIDEISTKFSIKIERSNTLNQLKPLPSEMTRKYCLLVNNYSLSCYSHTIKRTLNYINLNLSSPLSLKALSEKLKVNHTYLSSQFKKETGQTVTDFIHKQKINAAIQFLNTTTLPIQEIAYRVGIEDLSYFSKLFKNQINLSPIQYRNMMHR